MVSVPIDSIFLLPCIETLGLLVSVYNAIRKIHGKSNILTYYSIYWLFELCNFHLIMVSWYCLVLRYETTQLTTTVIPRCYLYFKIVHIDHESYSCQATVESRKITTHDMNSCRKSGIWIGENTGLQESSLSFLSWRPLMST